MKEITVNGIVLARHIVKEDIKAGLNFFSDDLEYVQVGVWGRYEQGKHLQEHIHNAFERIANRTHEVLYVIKGSIEAKIYSLAEAYVETIVVQEGDILVLLECGHGYNVLEDNTTVLEVKNGPYVGSEKDRYRF